MVGMILLLACKTLWHICQAKFRTKKPVIHISLNPHPDDRLSEEQFSAIALEYIERMGYGNQPFVVYKHEDIDRHHLHIVTLAVDEDGTED